MKPIHFHIYDPRERQLFFKSKANDHAKAYIIKCGNSENCDLFKKGQCAWKPTFGFTRCPHGTYQELQGPTKRARSIGEWVRKLREEYKGVPYIKEPVDKIAVVGDYIYAPYSHANMNEKVPYLSKGGAFMSGSDLIKKEDWTLETIQKIIDFVPYALFGGAITDYQQKIVPKFLLHLEEVMPGMYSELIKVRPEYLVRYNLINKNHVGRKALLKTISPCTFTSKGSREGNYRVTWVWDGKVLTTNSEHAYNSTWGDVDNADGIALTLTPSDRTIFVITDNAQVNPQTVFVD